ncbi:MAG: serine hydrolase domain-containing protein [Acidimicrobiales bacterium]
MGATQGRIDQAKVKALVERARREVDEGLLPSCQIALGYEGELVCNEVFGDATLDTQYCLYSATKPFVATTLGILIGEGKVDPAKPVAEYFPEFAANGKEAVTVEQVMLHQGGFPYAPMGPGVWEERQSRVDRMADWKLTWAPGSRYEYHPTSAHWVQAEIIERVEGRDFRDVVHERVTGKAGLSRIVGIPADQQQHCAVMEMVGEFAPPEEVKRVFGVEALPGREYLEDLVLSLNSSPAREAGVPGAGGFGRAADLALWYQELLHNRHEVWTAATLAELTGNIRSMLPDYAKVPASRTLAFLVAGDDGFANLRGLGRAVSPRAFGHNGAGGQLAWADPATGLSLGYTTNGFDRHEVRQPKRGTAIASLAAVCAS